MKGVEVAFQLVKVYVTDNLSEVKAMKEMNDDDERYQILKVPHHERRWVLADTKHESFPKGKIKIYRGKWRICEIESKEIFNKIYHNLPEGVVAMIDLLNQQDRIIQGIKSASSKPKAFVAPPLKLPNHGKKGTIIEVLNIPLPEPVK